jgi:hypothetical protein
MHEKDYLEAIGVDWKIILKLMIEIEWKGVDWIGLAQGRVRWWDLVDTVPNIRVPYNARIVTGCETLSFSRMALIHGVSRLCCC